jgi:ABC-type cobalamin/Fe3+-siderophores transport system ATPase subunit
VHPVASALRPVGALAILLFGVAAAPAADTRAVTDSAGREPTASLDFGNQVRVLGQIERLADRGIAIMLSTHDPDHAFLCAHRVALLHHGRLARLGRPDEVITAESLREVYGVEVAITPVVRADGRTARVCVPALGDGILPAHPGPPS